MGSMSRMARCERFILKFNEIATAEYGPVGDRAKAIFKEVYLGVHDDCVYMFFGYKDEKQTFEFLVENGPLFFNPEASDKDTVENLREVFDNYGLTMHEVVHMLKDADLISKDFKPTLPSPRWECYSCKKEVTQEDTDKIECPHCHTAGSDGWAVHPEEGGKNAG